MKREDIGKRRAPLLCAAAGAALTVLMMVSAFTLERGTGLDHFAALLILLGLMALALGIFWREYRSVPLLLYMILPVAAAFFLRAMCLDYASLDYQDFLSQWAGVFRENGGFRAIAMDVGDYNAPYLYFMTAVSYLDFPDLYAYKLFSILFDVALAWGCLRLVRVLRPGREGDAAPAAAFALALLLPTVILNGSYWGQCDVIYGALAVHAAALALEGRSKSSVALMAVAFSFKLQTIFLLPLWGALWLGGRVKFRELWVFPGVYVLTILPAFLLGKPLKDILGVYVGQLGEYPRLTLNAPSVFQFVPNGMAVNEPLLTKLGILTAFLLAIAMLALAYLTRGRLGAEGYFLMGVVLAVGVPFFLPHMHERYFFLADVLTACWACANWKRGVPACVLAAGSSLLSYLVYLRLQYNVTMTVWGLQFVMPVEMLMMLGALIWSILALWPYVKISMKNSASSGDTDTGRSE